MIFRTCGLSSQNILNFSFTSGRGQPACSLTPSLALVRSPGGEWQVRGSLPGTWSQRSSSLLPSVWEDSPCMSPTPPQDKRRKHNSKITECWWDLKNTASRLSAHVYVSPLNLHDNFVRQVLSASVYQKGSEKLRHFPHVAQLVGSRIKTRSQIFWLPDCLLLIPLPHWTRSPHVWQQLSTGLLTGFHPLVSCCHSSSSSRY